MIIDTTYLLPLARIGVRTDLLHAILKNRIPLKLEELKVSLISLFELQAKTSKLGIPPSYVIKAIKVIRGYFTVIPFYEADVVEEAHKLKDVLGDYIDRVIVATAIHLREGLVTEDSEILSIRDLLRKKGVNVMSFRDLVGGP